MSTFGGIMNEYTKISLDRFNDKNLQSTVYFLSHCHSDHMIGLNDLDFIARLRFGYPHVKLYCSEITTAFLLNDPRYMNLKPFVESLPIDENCTITILDEDDGEFIPMQEVTVTLLPAGHCPGSVMFLIEGNEGTVLYTGDFRFSSGSAARMKKLHSGDDIKDIRSLYIDTTFCVPEALHIPTREQSCDSLIELIREWTSRGTGHVVYLKCPAKYGYEYLFVEIFHKLGIRVHVDKAKLSTYAGVAEIVEAVDTEDIQSSVHACFLKVGNHFSPLPCGLSSIDLKLLTIQISVMWFTQMITINDVVHHDRPNHCRLIYSTHSSYTEICDFVAHLKPRNVYPNVTPKGSSDVQVIERLRPYCRLEMTNEEAPLSSVISLPLLGELKRLPSSDSSQENDRLFEVDVCSPPKKRIAIELPLKKSQRSPDSSQETEWSGRSNCSQTTPNGKCPQWEFICPSDSEGSQRSVVKDDSEVTDDRYVLIDLTQESDEGNASTPNQSVIFIDPDATPDHYTPDPLATPPPSKENGDVLSNACHKLKSSFDVERIQKAKRKLCDEF